jgi:hypothetical protein
MAIPDPKAKLVTVSFKGGTVTGTRGLMDFLFPSRIPSWLPNGESGIGKRPFGSKQADNRAAGRLLKLILANNAGTFSVRVTGTDTNFLKAFLGAGNTDKVLMVYTEAGTIYGPQYSVIGPREAQDMLAENFTIAPVEA